MTCADCNGVTSPLLPSHDAIGNDINSSPHFHFLFRRVKPISTLYWRFPAQYPLLHRIIRPDPKLFQVFIDSIIFQAYQKWARPSGLWQRNVLGPVGRGSCMALRRGGVWDSFRCPNKFPYLCERSKSLWVAVGSLILYFLYCE